MAEDCKVCFVTEGKNQATTFRKVALRNALAMLHVGEKAGEWREETKTVKHSKC